MAYAFSPELERKIQEHMTAGGYESEDELLLDAIIALERIKQRTAELRAEIQERLQTVGEAKKLNLEQLQAEIRRMSQIPK